MNRDELRAWARDHGDGDVEDRRDNKLSISSKLLRFRWNGAPTIGVGAEKESKVESKVRIDAVVDGVAWYLATAAPGDDTLNLILGVEPGQSDTPELKEQLGTIGTLVTALTARPQIAVWLLERGGDPQGQPMSPAVFDAATPTRWNAMLMNESRRTVSGLALELVDAIAAPSFALYPKLSSTDENQPWQMRLDGLEIGRIGDETATLAMATKKLAEPGEPRDTWGTLIGTKPLTFTRAQVGELVGRIATLVTAWTDPTRPGAALAHGQAEHALEAHLLSGRTRIKSAAAGPLAPAVPVEDGALRAAQFPTLWGSVANRARYLDALLVDGDRRPWAVELKDQDAGGGHGAYLRHGIGQAVLYRHFIRSASSLDPFFDEYKLKRTDCQAALAFPSTAFAIADKIQHHRALAARFDVEVIEFPRPGLAMTTVVSP